MLAAGSTEALARAQEALKGKATRLSRKVGAMNRTEAKYAELLEHRQRAGQVAEWHYEGLTFKLADDTRYTPDFVVFLMDGTMEVHETKGFMRDDARVKMRVLARMYPFTVRLCRLGKEGWRIEEVPA